MNNKLIFASNDQAVAKSVLPTGAWAYYSSGADDEITMRENRGAYQRIWFRPRILRDVTNVDFSTTILGHKVSYLPERLQLGQNSPAFRTFEILLILRHFSAFS